VLKFLEHFALVRSALNNLGLWNEDDGFFYDQLEAPDGTRTTLAVHSMGGVIPLLATMVLDEDLIEQAVRAGKQSSELFGAGARELEALAEDGTLRGPEGHRRLLLGVVEVSRIIRLVERLLDEEFLSPHGLRALSAFHRAHPYSSMLEGQDFTINYEPAESTTHMFGGNSNWRGPVWFPLNYLACDASGAARALLRRRHRRRVSDRLRRCWTYLEIATDLRKRLVRLFLADRTARGHASGRMAKFRDDPRWRDNVAFNEYFDGDTGKGLGASHQTGWTGLVADLILRVHDGSVSWIDHLFVDDAASE
jgi:hypothetical protein